MGAVHWIARLKRNHAAPSQADKLSSQLGWCKAQRAKIVMRRGLQAFNFSANIPGVGLVHHIICAGVRFARAVEYGLGFSGPVWLPDFFYVQYGEHHAFGVAQ